MSAACSAAAAAAAAAAPMAATKRVPQEGNIDEGLSVKEDGGGVAGSGLNAIRNALRSRGSNSCGRGHGEANEGQTVSPSETGFDQKSRNNGSDEQQNTTSTGGDDGASFPDNSRRNNLPYRQPAAGTAAAIAEKEALSQKEVKRRRVLEETLARERVQKYLDSLKSKHKAKEEQVTPGHLWV